MVSFHLKRHMGYFIIEVYAPCTMLVVLSWVAFWINREATADRVALGVTTVLTMTFLGLECRNNLPKVPYCTALDYYVAISFGFIFATIIQFAIVHHYTKVGSGEYYFPPTPPEYSGNEEEKPKSQKPDVTFRSSDANKETLTCTDHEEADTKIIQHICNIDVQANFAIQCSDTDMAAIMLGNMRHLKNEDSHVCILTGIGNRLFINTYMVSAVNEEFIRKNLKNFDASKSKLLQQFRRANYITILWSNAHIKLGKQWTDEHRATRKTGSGRLKVTSASDDRHLLCMTVNDRTVSSRHLTARWSAATGVLMLASSIRLHRGLRARVPLYRISLTTNHQSLRQQWGHEYRTWQADWDQVVFSDESRFN
ncbi:gamma-aminobutyric acid receptor alpha-like [Trichonephila clavipes]|nr:gamma-aminobutyric acid receptor alpha-like [Trichonephila clavipes]